MPREDGTGPEGAGSKTGRGLGPCGGQKDNKQNIGKGLGRGQGGRGLGKGQGGRGGADRGTNRGRGR